MTEICAAMIYGLDYPSYEQRNNLGFASLRLPIPDTSMWILLDNNAEATSTGYGSMTKEAATYEVGNLQIASSAPFRGYYNNEVATREAFTEDG